MKPHTRKSQETVATGSINLGSDTGTAAASHIPASSTSISSNVDDRNADFSNRTQGGVVHLNNDALRLARIQSNNEDGCYFIPVNKLDELITLESIHKELEDRDIGLQCDRLQLARQICESASVTQNTTRRKIFAILALMEKVDAIRDFIRQGVCDSALPFIFSTDDFLISKRTKEPIMLFQNRSKWKSSEKDMFEKYQWEMMTPCFNLSPKGKTSFGRMLIEDRAVLPFIEVHDIEIEGGFSTVRKVKVHPAHYNAHNFSTPEEQTYFAVKTLNFDAEANVFDDQEVQSLIRLNNENNENLIRLLVTFQYQKRVHLVFPWAHGNLQDFWKKDFPDPEIPVRDSNLAKWMAEQCLGLALGLQAIHQNSVDETLALEQGLQWDASKKRHGRHGDFKPENVLWFNDANANTSNTITGVLKVSDFGFADFHASRSRSKIPLEKLRGMTPTYRAPEWDIKEDVAPSYDLWCFGCVLLEFVEWYLRGWQGVKDFGGKRISDSKHEIAGYREDNFFNTLTHTGQHRRRAAAKISVHADIQDLRHHDKCSDFILDLLDFIEDHLLRMRPEMRASSDKVVDKFDEFLKKCLDDSTYCTQRRQKIREKRNTDLSELSHKWSKYDESASPSHTRSSSSAQVADSGPSNSPLLDQTAFENATELERSIPLPTTSDLPPNMSRGQEPPAAAEPSEPILPQISVLEVLEEQQEDLENGYLSNVPKRRVASSEQAQDTDSTLQINNTNTKKNSKENVTTQINESIAKTDTSAKEEGREVRQDISHSPSRKLGTTRPERESRRALIKRSIVEHKKKSFHFLFSCTK